MLRKKEEKIFLSLFKKYHFGLQWSSSHTHIASLTSLIRIFLGASLGFSHGVPPGREGGGLASSRIRWLIFFLENFLIVGKWLYIGNDQKPYVGGRAAIISPPITKQSKLCSIVFFYRVGNKDKAGLSLYIQTGKSGLSLYVQTG